jgi:hypothetical protein
MYKLRRLPDLVVSRPFPNGIFSKPLTVPASHSLPAA